jgi:hypothetical protein
MVDNAVRVTKDRAIRSWPSKLRRNRHDAKYCLGHDNVMGLLPVRSEVLIDHPLPCT